VTRIAVFLFTSAILAGARDVRLKAGVTVLDEPLVFSGEDGLVITGTGSGSVLRASGKFRGVALIHIRNSSRVTLRGFTVDGARSTHEKPVGIAPSDVPFHRFYTHNGVVAEGVAGMVIDNVRFEQVVNFPVIVSHSTQVRIRRARIQDSGSRNAKGRNNTSGGILIEEGTIDFQVLNCRFTRIRGNAIWTHSLYTSKRNADGVIAENDITQVARDAIQVGHATNVRVERNTGSRIGWPVEEVDVENQGWPVAIDTAGNVDKSIYAFNTFTELNGKCLDLDGFHHGEVRRNRCVNAKPAKNYPYGHFGLVMNNTNPDMQSEAIVIADNEFEGMKYGGIFVIGSGHRIEKNRMRFLNTAGCNPNTPCIFKEDEPLMLRSGIYLGKGAERPAPADRNIIVDNLVMGIGMKDQCVNFAPGIDRSTHQVERNICLEPPAARAAGR
jgi:hypothetical protein